MLPLVKAVIFDLDGTLIDTIHDLADSVNEVLKARNFPNILLNPTNTESGME